jgi:pimeloyl-ACP methyl ester carboxylesterase
MKWLKVLLGIILSLYLLILLAAYLLQDKLLFFPDKLNKNFGYELAAGDTEVFIKTPDETWINGILYRRPGNTDVILYFHGNAGSLRGWQNVAPDLLLLNVDLLLVDTRGYGKSGGVFSEQGFNHDAQAALDFLHKSGYSDKHIIVYGRSLGTGIAMDLAVNNLVKALILETPYTSMRQLGGEKMPYFLPWLLLKYKFNNLEKAPRLKMPVLILHGKNDELIPYSHSQKIFAAITSSQKKLVLINDGGHNNLSDFPEHHMALQDFLNSLK